MAYTLAITASLLNLVGYVWYIRILLRGGSRPNASSWLVWMGVTVVSVSSYTAATGDVVKSLFSWSLLVVNVVSFFFIMRRARLSSLSRLDVSALVIGLVAAAAWYFLRSAWWGNILIQVAIVIGGIPTIASVWREPANERPGPWLLWGAAYAALALVIVFRWDGNALELVYPLVGASLYGSVGLLALRAPTQ